VLIGLSGSDFVHELQQFVGEYSNDALVALRNALSKCYGLDFGEKHVFDAVMALALQHRFDPVLDMLEDAEKNWDQTPRLDGWVITYLGCDDTKLNRTIGRKVLIAAVRRARKPGCKFDNITVLEGPEGTNKSTVIRVLAGDDNFSDQSLLGARDKEVQEQLNGVWMHENADLAGMKKADVESVKAFASRTTDIARPAYARSVERRKRRSIEWGTTNNSMYLRSPTGNRRFWPLKTGIIDIDALKRDRLQLLGEAGHYESQGESLLLGATDHTLWDDIAKAQEQRRAVDPWEDVLRNPREIEHLFSLVVHHSRNEKKLNVASRDILSTVFNIPVKDQNETHSMRLAAVMKNVGWQRNDHGKVTIKGVSVRGYWKWKSEA
jgi:predicted P-loop ATPase